MNNVMILAAVIFCVAAVLTGTFTENSWRNTGITWGLLSIGATLFGIGLTL